MKDFLIGIFLFEDIWDFLGLHIYVLLTEIVLKDDVNKMRRVCLIGFYYVSNAESILAGYSLNIFNVL